MGYEVEGDKYLCYCCGKNFNKQQFDYNCGHDELACLGLGYPLFFTLSKHFIFLILSIWLFNGFYAFSTNVIGDDCKHMDTQGRILALSNNECVYSVYTFWSMANKKSSLGENYYQTFFDVLSCFT